MTQCYFVWHRYLPSPNAETSILVQHGVSQLLLIRLSYPELYTDDLKICTKLGQMIKLNLLLPNKTSDLYSDIPQSVLLLPSERIT